MYPEAELQKMPTSHHSNIESVKDALIVSELSGKIIFTNRAAEELFGYSPEELLGRNIDVIFPLELIHEKKQMMERMRWGEGIKKDGTEFPVEVSLSPIDAEGGVLVLAAIRDIASKEKTNTELQNYADQLEISNTELKKLAYVASQDLKRLELSNKELEQFAYVASHDLKVPLRKILIFTGQMLENDSITVKGRKYFQLINKTADRMQALIEDLLTFSSLVSKDKAFEKINLKSLVKKVKKTFSEELKEKKATIEIGELCEADIIEFQICQLMHNLISNALKFTRNGIQPHIKIQGRRMKGSDLQSDKLQPNVEYCHIFVSDNGIGIEEEYQEKVFGVFEKLHNRDEYEGTGIGLAIVKKIVDNHHGFITVRSVLNAGTTFDIYFPAHHGNEENEKV